MANLRAALEALQAHGIETEATSTVYETEPQAGAVGQQDFLNAVVRVITSLDPNALLRAAKQIEVDLGRDPQAPRHSQRPIDIDILIIDGERIDRADYRVPHADVEHRRFVLQPLLELDPPDRERLEEALAEIEGQRVTRFGAL